MTPPDSTPKLPLWTFLVTDAVLLGTAFFIAQEAARPLSPTAIAAIAGCVLAGALVMLVPLVMRLERQKNEVLDERQRELEALARTITTSAEQISIAANGLHQIAELTQKNLRHADHLPQKLHEKIAEFKAQLVNATDAEKEELENELVALRASESERLQATSDRIARTAGELTKLEAATHQHLHATTEALTKLSASSVAAIAQAQANTEHALDRARGEATRTLGESTSQAASTIAAAKLAAIAEIDTRFAEAGTALVAQVTRELSKIELARATPPPQIAEPAAVSPVEQPASAAEDAAPSSAPVAAEPLAAEPEPPIRRPRKPRREEVSVPAAPVEAAPPEVQPTDPTESAAVIAAPPPPAAPEPEIAVEAAPPPAPAVTVETSQPESPTPPSVETSAVPAESAPAVEEAPKPARKRAKKPEAEIAPTLELGIEDAPAPAERGLSSDGATRLVVTAYIGIGNRLFIRGAGAGLTWEKGVPLQFVSIGKWRWETNDATAPVEFKIYKNDEQECAALGVQSVEPGYQQEMTATF